MEGPPSGNKVSAAAHSSVHSCWHRCAAFPADQGNRSLFTERATALLLVWEPHRPNQPLQLSCVPVQGCGVLLPANTVCSPEQWQALAAALVAQLSLAGVTVQAVLVENGCQLQAAAFFSVLSGLLWILLLVGARA